MQRFKLYLLLFATMVTLSPLAAQADLGFKGVGAKVGFVSVQNDIGSSLGFGVMADWGTILPRLNLFSSLDYWSHSESAGNNAEGSWRDITVAATAHYYFPLSSSKVMPYAAGGLAIHFYKASVDIPNQAGFNFGSASASTTAFGIDLGGGVQMNLSPTLDLVADGRFRVGEANFLAITAGALYRF
ncbi:MAG TPA: outer membrane beta-barrel protein [Calditrichia bacterium]|nr:porin family protein [Calditrichota bacterium]HQU74102.1 outer membrane beta-barrel protein [Calditrichia bacterium]HQV30782.1 outer membrane beta-barrel protein [Calditrichia bacterium]